MKENDFATPKRRRTNLKLFKTTISSLRCRNKHLVRRTRRLEKKVSSLKEIIDELTKSNLVSESATENLKVKYNLYQNIALSFDYGKVQC